MCSVPLRLARASFSAFLLAACSPSDPADSPVPGTVAIPADAVYAGEFVLRGEVALRTGGGSATIEIVPRGGDTPVLARSWDLGDPAWRPARDSLRLYFLLDARDAWPGAAGRVAPEMDLVARFDPDGNPATEELGVARTRVPVRTGDRECAVELSAGLPVAVNADHSGG